MVLNLRDRLVSVLVVTAIVQRLGLGSFVMVGGLGCVMCLIVTLR